jgi:hypothetical protein
MKNFSEDSRCVVRDSNQAPTLALRQPDQRLSTSVRFRFFKFLGMRWVWVHLVRRPPTVDQWSSRWNQNWQGNRSTRRKVAPVPLCPPQISHDLTQARIRAAVLGSRRLTAWAMVRPTWIRYYLIRILERSPVLLGLLRVRAVSSCEWTANVTLSLQNPRRRRLKCTWACDPWTDWSQPQENLSVDTVPDQAWTDVTRLEARMEVNMEDTVF